MASTECSADKKRAHFTFIWKIKYGAGKTFIESPTFKIQSMEMTKWKMCLAFSPRCETTYCWIKREEKDDGPESIEIEFVFFFPDIAQFSIYKRAGTEHFRNNESSEEMEFPLLYAISDEDTYEYYSSDLLTVGCRIWRTNTEISKSELCFASSEYGVQTHSCIWAVKKFSSLKQGEQRTRILNLASKRCPQMILTLCLDKLCNETNVFINLEALNLTKDFMLEADVKVLDADGKVVRGNCFAGELNIRNSKRAISVIEKHELMSSAAVSDDVLLLECDFKFIYSVLVRNEIEAYKLMDYRKSKTIQLGESETNFDKLNENDVCPFKETVNEFRNDIILSDVSLRAGTVSFPAHKLILSCRSPVFKAMFTKDMKEKTSKCIDIPDMDAETLHQLLLYIYEDKIQELTWQMMANLFQAADKYELLDLKEKCSHFLTSYLSESNVCQTVVLADMHHDGSLQNSVHDFILNNSEIICSDRWKDFRQNHPKLALETAEQIIYNMKHPSC